MKKKNPLLYMAAILLAVSVFAAATFTTNVALAKYTATASGAAEGAIAAFSVEVNGQDVVSGDVTIDLFGTVVDWGPGDDDNVRGTNLMAPGTKGAFELEIVNTGDVTTTVALTLSANNLGVLADNPAFKLYKDGGVFAATPGTQLYFVTLAPGETVGDAPAFEWVWEFEDNTTQNPIDMNAIGGATPSLVFSVTADQVD